MLLWSFYDRRILNAILWNKNRESIFYSTDTSADYCLTENRRSVGTACPGAAYAFAGFSRISEGPLLWQSIRLYTKEIISLQNNLRQRLDPEDLELVEALEQNLDRRSCEEEELAFEIGFQTAIQMVVAGLSVPAEAIKKGEDVKW